MNETRRYFAVAHCAEIDENEFNLNLPRYIDTFEPEEKIEIGKALECDSQSARYRHRMWKHRAAELFWSGQA